MGTAAQRAKSRTGRAKAIPVAARPALPREAEETPQAVVDAIFRALPDARHANGGVPEVVRANRRERARRRLLEAIQSRGAYPVPEARWGEARTLAERWAQKDLGAALLVDTESSSFTSFYPPEMAARLGSGQRGRHGLSAVL